MGQNVNNLLTYFFRGTCYNHSIVGTYGIRPECWRQDMTNIINNLRVGFNEKYLIAGAPQKKAADPGTTRNNEQIEQDYRKMIIKRKEWEVKLNKCKEEYKYYINHPEKYTKVDITEKSNQIKLLTTKIACINTLLEDTPPIDWSFLTYDNNKAGEKAEKDAKNGCRTLIVLDTIGCGAVGIGYAPLAAVTATFGAILAAAVSPSMIHEAVNTAYDKYPQGYKKAMESAILYKEVIRMIYPELDPKNPNFNSKNNLTLQDTDNFLNYCKTRNVK